jgi:dipeptidyl-peptidase-4
MGQPEENEAGYLEGNVLNSLANLDGQLLLMHGMADDNVLFTHSTMIINELQRLNKQFELMVYPGAKHSLHEKHVSKHRFRMILDFFHRTL